MFEIEKILNVVKIKKKIWKTKKPNPFDILAKAELAFKTAVSCKSHLIHSTKNSVTLS